MYRLSITTLLFTISLVTVASNIYTDDKDVVINKISFDYSLYQKNGIYDCRGPLNILVETPPNSKGIILERTAPTDKNPETIMFRLKSQHPVNYPLSEISLPDVPWGTYFRVHIILNDDNWIHSQILSINDYITEQDLDLLFMQSGVDNISSEGIEFNVNDKTLYIKTIESLTITIYDNLGRLVFIGDICDSSYIPLDVTSSPYIIIKCFNSNNSITKKILLP